MKIRKLFYKDLSGLRFVGMICIFTYVITYILTTQNSSNFSKELLLFSSTLKNTGISIFLIISSFLITALGLREYKYFSKFSLLKFYYRRGLRLFPALCLALIFYFVVHPLLIYFLNLTPISDENQFYNLFFLPSSYQNLTREVLIYLYFIYGIFVIIQYYLIWGVVLKYLNKYLMFISILFVIIGITFKYADTISSFSTYMYLPFYFYEIGIGAITAILVRGNSSIINVIKTTSSSVIGFIYFSGISIALLVYIVSDSSLISLLTKLYSCLIFSFYIFEQTFAKHSLFKMRNSQFTIQLGNLSYSFILFAPIISVIILIALESTEISLNSNVSMLVFPVVCFFSTWVISYFYHHYIDRFFSEIRKELRPI
ncbi:MAG: acyltransferase family protein [Crocinitomicaceae bacterium]